MLGRIFQLTIIFLLLFSVVNAQTNIKKAWKDANPLKSDAPIPVAEKLKIHGNYLKQAMASNNITQQFYGNIYLYTDNMDEQDYTSAMPFILAAENIAKESDNVSWQGFVKLRMGWVACIVQNDIKKAITEYQTGAKLCIQGNDSLCVAECYEQISTMYSGLKNFDSSQYYFDLAMPVLRKSSSIQLYAVYNNYSSLLVNEGRQAEALLYIDSAIAIIQHQQNKRKEISLLTNRGVILNSLKKYDSAEAVFKYCMAVDLENKWMGNLMYDYEGLSGNYHDKGNDAEAYAYREKYQVLKDSLSGVSVNLKISGITAAYKNELDDLAAKNVLQKRNWIIASAAFLLLIALLIWRLQYSSAKREQLKNKNSLAELTRILLEKNTQLTSFEQQVNELNNTATIENLKKEGVQEKELIVDKHTDFEKSLYNQSILTAADWAAFKLYFDKGYPGYLLRLRNSYPALTEAEERLFLFIKLKITNKEAAAILGISADSVKKTRSRLRKRLGLPENVDLEAYVSNF